nr:hypothetical protein CFP56_26315 [Quercus suber]
MGPTDSKFCMFDSLPSYKRKFGEMQNLIGCGLFSLHRSRVVLSSFKELVKLFFTKSELVPPTTAWLVWFHRNKFRVGENARPLGQIVSFERDYVRDFKSLKSSTPMVRVATQKIRKPPTVEALELLAAKRTAFFSEELGLDRVIFEGDSEQVMKALQWGGRNVAPGGHLIRDILCIVNSFVSTSFTHVCR